MYRLQSHTRCVCARTPHTPNTQFVRHTSKKTHKYNVVGVCVCVGGGWVGVRGVGCVCGCNVWTHPVQKTF